MATVSQKGCKDLRSWLPPLGMPLQGCRSSPSLRGESLVLLSVAVIFRDGNCSILAYRLPSRPFHQKRFLIVTKLGFKASPTKDIKRLQPPWPRRSFHFEMVLVKDGEGKGCHFNISSATNCCANGGYAETTCLHVGIGPNAAVEGSRSTPGATSGAGTAARFYELCLEGRDLVPMAGRDLLESLLPDHFFKVLFSSISICFNSMNSML